MCMLLSSWQPSIHPGISWRHNSQTKLQFHSNCHVSCQDLCMWSVTYYASVSAAVAASVRCRMICETVASSVHVWQSYHGRSSGECCVSDPADRFEQWVRHHGHWNSLRPLLLAWKLALVLPSPLLQRCLTVIFSTLIVVLEMDFLFRPL